MKIQNNKNSYPGFSDTYVAYEGTISTMATSYGAYNSETYYEFKITTEIKNNLNVYVICSYSSRSRNDVEPTNLPVQILKSFILPHIVTIVGGNAVITVRVPPSCLANYRISGDTALLRDLPPNPEVTETPGILTEGLSSFGHSHEGIDSAKILGSTIKPNSGNAGKFYRVDSSGSLTIYSDPVGAPGLFDLLTPTSEAYINLTNSSQTAFSWEASSGATDYTLYIRRKDVDEETLTHVMGSATTTYNVLHSLLVPYKDYFWFVVATDGTETTSSPTFNFHTVDSTDGV